MGLSPWKHLYHDNNYHDDEDRDDSDEDIKDNQSREWSLKQSKYDKVSYHLNLKNGER